LSRGDDIVTSEEAADLRRRWLNWTLVSVAMALYSGAAEIESHTTADRLPLTPGKEIELTLVRLFENPLQLDLEFKAEACPQRPELTSRQAAAAHDGLLRLTPGANVRLEARTGDDVPVTFEAMPVSAYCNGDVRVMTTNLSVEPGVYRWPPPPALPRIMLHPGLNWIRLKVTMADPPVGGETASVYALGALGLKSSWPNVAWLWPALFLDLVFAATQSVWLLLLVRRTWRVRRRSRVAGQRP
jgi:hypothetical protein